MMPTRLTRDQLIAELGIAGLGSDVQDEILSAIGENITQAVMLAVLLKLPPAAQQEFKTLSDAGNAEGIAKLLRSTIDNPDSVIEEAARQEIAGFKETFAKKLAS